MGNLCDLRLIEERYDYSDKLSHQLVVIGIIKYFTFLSSSTDTVNDGTYKRNNNATLT